MTSIMIELLINMKSKKGREALPQILRACQELEIKVDIINEIVNPELLDDTLAKIKERSPSVLIVASGDGTVSDVVDHLVDTEITLGIIPLGTTNNFARSLGLPLDAMGAMRVVKDGKIKKVDLGKIDDDHFSNVAGIGLSAQIAKNVTNKQKRRYGRFAYLMTGLGILLRHKSFFVTVADKDGELQLHFETHQVIIANGRFHAGKEIAVDARLDSRELIIFKLGGKSRFGMAWHMADFYFGRRRNIYHSSYLIGKDLQISTSTPQPVELDGEVKLTTPIGVTVSSKAIKVFQP